MARCLEVNNLRHLEQLLGELLPYLNQLTEAEEE